MDGLCDYGCGQEAKYEMSNGKVCCSENWQSCPKMKKKNSEGLKKAFERGDKNAEHLAEHLDGNRAWNKGKTLDIGEGGKKPIAETVNKRHIKKKLIQQRGHKCEGCNGKKHRGEKIPLELHRIDETKTYEDSTAKNFKLLCPNCHAQTDNYRGKKSNNKGKQKVTDKELKKALDENESIRQALLSVGLEGAGANYKRAKKLMGA